MKISLIQENLAKALNYCNRAVSTRPNIPVLANVLIEADKGKLKLSATNLEVGITTWIGATVGSEGKLTVSAKLLSEFVNSLHPGKIDMTLAGQTLEVNSVDNTAQFVVIPAEDFPRVPSAEGDPILEINAGDLARAIEQTAFAASTDESRPVLTGILITAENKQLNMVAVDGFRLSKKNLKLEKALKVDNFKEIVPARSLMEVAKLVRDNVADKDAVKVYYLGNKNQMLFKIGDVDLSTRLIEGDFPDYEKIMPKEKSLRFRAKKVEFADALKVVTIFARNVVGNKARVKVDTETEKLSLSASVVDVGKNESMVNLEDVEGENFETGYNVRFLTDMVNTLSGSDFVFETNGPTAPGVFLDPKDSEFIHIIMPMRLD